MHIVRQVQSSCLTGLQQHVRGGGQVVPDGPGALVQAVGRLLHPAQLLVQLPVFGQLRFLGFGQCCRVCFPDIRVLRLVAVQQVNGCLPLHIVQLLAQVIVHGGIRRQLRRCSLLGILPARQGVQQVGHAAGGPLQAGFQASLDQVKASLRPLSQTCVFLHQAARRVSPFCKVFACLGSVPAKEIQQPVVVLCIILRLLRLRRKGIHRFLGHGGRRQHRAEPGRGHGWTVVCGIRIFVAGNGQTRLFRLALGGRAAGSGQLCAFVRLASGFAILLFLPCLIPGEEIVIAHLSVSFLPYRMPYPASIR